MQSKLTRKLAQKGFTLIELIITIVIIGVLAAVAIPKFQNLSGDAEKGVASGVAAALASATSVNYGRSKVPGAVACAVTPAVVDLGTSGCTYYAMDTCAKLNAVVAKLADFPSGYSVGDSGTTALTATGTAVSGCTVEKTGVTPTVFSAYGA